MYDIQKYFSAHSIAEALDLLREYPGAIIVAGGTDIMVHLRQRKLRDAVLIGIREIPELNGIHLHEDRSIVIGAGTCFDTIYQDTLINRYIPILAEAANQVGSPQIRHVATIGGNLCNGAVSADSAPSLLAMDVKLEFRSKESTRILPISEFYIGPGKTALQSDHELLTAIIIPQENYENWNGCYLKFGQRNAMEISTLSCAATVKLEKDKTHIAALNLAFGVAAAKPVRCPRLESSVVGMAADDMLWQKIHTEVLSELNPRDSWRASRELREQLIRTLSVRAVKKAIERAGGKNNGL